MARLEFNSNIIAGIKDKNNVYRHVSQGHVELFKYSTPEKVRGLTEHQVSAYAFDSIYSNSYDTANELIAEDEKALNNQQLFIFESVIIHRKPIFALVHKQPYVENNKITGSVFQTLLLPHMTKQIAKSYLQNANILISKHTKIHLEALGLDSTCKYKLTHRELECIRFLTKGASANDIAHTLGLSKRTIDFYIRNIKDKLNVRKTTEIIITALADGIVDGSLHNMLY